MKQYNNRPFSTKDQDNDNWPENCAVLRRSGWWHNKCIMANLNGQYYEVNNKIINPLLFGKDGEITRTL